MHIKMSSWSCQGVFRLHRPKPILCQSLPALYIQYLYLVGRFRKGDNGAKLGGDSGCFKVFCDSHYGVSHASDLLFRLQILRLFLLLGHQNMTLLGNSWQETGEVVCEVPR